MPFEMDSNATSFFHMGEKQKKNSNLSEYVPLSLFNKRSEWLRGLFNKMIDKTLSICDLHWQNFLGELNID